MSAREQGPGLTLVQICLVEVVGPRDIHVIQTCDLCIATCISNAPRLSSLAP